MASTENKDQETNKELKDEPVNVLAEIGEFGKFQARIVAICALHIIFFSWSYNEYVFSTARIPTRCKIPECDSENPEFHPSWILNAIPGTSTQDLNNCLRYSISSNFTLDSDPDLSCSDKYFDRTSTESCKEYVYGNTDTVVYDLDLACNDWKRSIIGTAWTIGQFLSAPLFGYLSDHWGRRLAIAVASFNTAWLGLARYWANTYWGVLASEFMEAVLGSGGYSCAFIIVMELLGPKYRAAGIATLCSFFSIGQVILGLLAWAVPNWRNMILAIYIPQFLTLTLFFVMKESIRWLISKGRYEKAERILQNAAKINGKPLSEKSLQAFKISCEVEKKINEHHKLGDEPWLPVLVFRCKPVLFRITTVPILWFTLTLVYYGLSLNAVNLSGNKYLNYVAVSTVDVPGLWTGFILVNKIGRKRTLMIAYWICFFCMMGYIFITSDLIVVSLLIYLLGKFSITIVGVAIYVYTAEIYPTQYRHTLFAFCSMIGRVGSMVAPLTPALAVTVWAQFPYALFASFSLISGLLMLLLPETLGTKLPDTMDETGDLGNNTGTK